MARYMRQHAILSGTCASPSRDKVQHMSSELGILTALSVAAGMKIESSLPSYVGIFVLKTFLNYITSTLAILPQP